MTESNLLFKRLVNNINSRESMQRKIEIESNNKKRKEKLEIAKNELSVHCVKAK